MTIDPDFALAMGVSIGSTIGALAIWFAWDSPYPPSLGLIVAVASAALVGAVLLGYLARKAAQCGNHAKQDAVPVTDAALGRVSDLFTRACDDDASHQADKRGAEQSE